MGSAAPIRCLAEAPQREPLRHSQMARGTRQPPRGAIAYSAATLLDHLNFSLYANVFTREVVASSAAPSDVPPSRCDSPTGSALNYSVQHHISHQYSGQVGSAAQPTHATCSCELVGLLQAPPKGDA